MTKTEFLEALRRGLTGLPQSDIDEQIAFYTEMIDDRIEDGLSEEDAVRDVGDADDIIAQIIAETPIIKLVKEKIKPVRTVGAREIVLLALGFPVWFPLLISAFAVIFALYVSLWAVIISFWSIFASFIGCAFGGIAGGTALIALGEFPAGTVLIAAGFVCAGFSILSFHGCKAASKGIILFTKKLAIKIKNGFIKKEEA